MKNLNPNVVLILFLLPLLFSCSHSGKKEPAITNSEPAFDSLLAQKYGADKYGMKQYVMAFLKRGPIRSQDSAEAVKLQQAHLENITRLAEEGKLVLAGPFLGDSEIRGIYIFDVKTIEEARELTASDPSIQQGRLEMELHPWYGSAALMEINNLHKKFSKVGVTE